MRQGMDRKKEGNKKPAKTLEESGLQREKRSKRGAECTRRRHGRCRDRMRGPSVDPRSGVRRVRNR